nr:DUF4350 domain-containing protein [Flexivirga aerilata]
MPRNASEPLDPDSPAPDGTRAAAQVLGQQGLSVDIARSPDEFGARSVAGATVLITRPQLLADDTLRSVMEHAAGARRVVVVDADPATARAMQLPDVQAAPVEDAPSTVCSVPWLQGLRMSYADVEYTAGSVGASCFGEGGSGTVLVLPEINGGRPETVLVGSHAVFANKTVVDDDNAAIALRTLGSADRVVWFAPTVATADNPLAQGPAWPRWFGPSVWLAAAVAILVIVWRARRFGRLVPEPLPVVVPADETTRSRGLLYRKAGDTARSSRVLRAATRGRLASYLGLPPSGPAGPLVERVAHAAGADPRDVHDLLLGPDAADESSMTDIAHRLQLLERQVRR